MRYVPEIDSEIVVMVEHIADVFNAADYLLVTANGDIYPCTGCMPEVGAMVTLHYACYGLWEIKQ